VTSINETDLDADLEMPKKGKRAIDAKTISRRYMPGGRGSSCCAAKTSLRNIKLISRTKTKHRPVRRRAVSMMFFGSVLLTLFFDWGIIGFVAD
jgi:hypothetical protein